MILAPTTTTKGGKTKKSNNAKQTRFINPNRTTPMNQTPTAELDLFDVCKYNKHYKVDYPDLPKANLPVGEMAQCIMEDCRIE